MLLKTGQSVECLKSKRYLEHFKSIPSDWQELCFEHLVVRNSQGYSFGPCTGIQLQLDAGEVVASKDGLVYEPFKECCLWDCARYILHRKALPA